jgi:signal transduction histidine kinase
VESRNEEIQFCVKDSGPGIPENELSRIFDQYWQAQQNKVGSGLGLYISKGLVVAHGGRIWVETAVGEGTSVYFTIPKRNVADLPRSEADLSRTSSTLR